MRIKILYILPSAQLGGAETQLLNILKNINRNKFQTFLGFIHKNSQLEKEFSQIKDNKIVYFDKKGKFDVLVYRKILNFIRKEKINIVHSFLGNHYSFIPCLFTKNVKAIGGIRSTCAGNDSFIERIMRFDLLRIIFKQKEFYLISNSYKGKNIYVKKGFPSNSIYVIPNGIDINKFLNGNGKKIINEFGLENKIVLTMVARIEKEKNHEELLNVFYDLQKKFDNLRLLIIGDGPYLPELKRVTEEKKLTSKVIFTGLRKNIADFLSETDIFVFPSKYPEGWPNVVGEAMCEGVPVISYPCGDVRKIIRNGYDGIITEANEVAFKEQLIPLIKSSKYREYLGLNARKTILKKFTIPIMVKNYEKIYLKLLRR